MTKKTEKLMTEKEANMLLLIDSKIDSLYEKKTQLVTRIANRCGDCEVVLNVGDVAKPFRRVRVVDQLTDFAEGKPVYRTAALTRFSVVISKLKNMPKPVKTDK